MPRLLRLQNPAHEDAVAGEATDEGVIAGGGQGELEGFLFVHVQQLGVMQNVVTGRDEAFFEAGGAHDDGGVHDGVGFAGLGVIGPFLARLKGDKNGSATTRRRGKNAPNTAAAGICRISKGERMANREVSWTSLLFTWITSRVAG